MRLTILIHLFICSIQCMGKQAQWLSQVPVTRKHQCSGLFWPGTWVLVLIFLIWTASPAPIFSENKNGMVKLPISWGGGVLWIGLGGGVLWIGRSSAPTAGTQANGEPFFFWRELNLFFVSQAWNSFWLLSNHLPFSPPTPPAPALPCESLSHMHVCLFCSRTHWI